MDAVTYTQVRQNFASVMDKVCDDHMPLIITRQNRAPVVMISLEDYNGMEETLYLMRSPKNYARLTSSTKNVRKKRVQERDLIEEDNAGI
ncbi:MAG: type II toxin-antitoxin system prevent-host-death family antitoxin [Parachlamydiaceae bacterium]|nr:type II toxin-antitoxin system prevent-host-death family antitoxin [Parachlamydiaceae bacterium]